MLGRFETARRVRPLDLLAPGTVAFDLERPGVGVGHRLECPAPYAAVVAVLAEPDAPVRVWVRSRGVTLSVHLDADRGTGLEVEAGPIHTTHASRRHGRSVTPVDAVALTLTGTWLTVLTRSRHGSDGGRPTDTWTVRGRVELAGPDHPAPALDTHDEVWLDGLEAGVETGTEGPGAARLVGGGFGQLGLRDLRFVTEPDGGAVHDEGRLLLTATSAGPGFFPTAHTSVWALDPQTLDLTHRGDLFFRRPGARHPRRAPARDRVGVYGDHATHLLRDPDGPGWLVATSTWGDFDRRDAAARVSTTLSRSAADLTRGRHVLDAEPLPLPTTGLRSVGVWDPHLVHTGEEWLVGYVSARRYFSFHPVLAGGPRLDRLGLRAAAADRRATEGTTLLRVDGEWRVLASDGRDGRRGQRAAYPILGVGPGADLHAGLVQLGSLDADYPTNLPWPSLARDGSGWLMVGFDATPTGGPLPGYGTHGDVVISRSPGPLPSR